jgi:hypothetical protein
MRGKTTALPSGSKLLKLDYHHDTNKTVLKFFILLLQAATEEQRNNELSTNVESCLQQALLNAKDT